MSTPGSGAGAPGEEALASAARALRQGRIVGIPTDTVYGLAADPTRPGATAALFAAKGRPAHLELPVLVADMAQAEELAGPEGMPPPARRLAAAFWPGALTLVVTRRRGLDWDLGGNAGTIGLRCPAHDAARFLCRKVGPLATTSANRHGQPPLTTADALVAEFGPDLPVVDGGLCDGVPSTVVDVSGPTMHCLREGAVPWADVEQVAGSRP